MATKARIDRRRLTKRNGHSVKCARNMKYVDTCTCSKSPGKFKLLP